MAFTLQALVQMVLAKIDEILPPGEQTEGITTIEAPVKFITRELSESCNYVLGKAPDIQVRQVIKRGVFHFPEAPGAFTGLVSVGGTNVTNNNLTAINSVSYRINGNPFGLNPMPVTIAADPATGLNRRDIIVGNDQNQLEYIAGSANANPDALDFPNTPSGKVLVMKVIILDDGAGGFNKTYLSGPTTGSSSNPNIRIIYDPSTGISKIPLPTDFLRFMDIQLENWLVPVSNAMKQTDPKYIREKSIPDLGGTEIKPKAAIVSFSEYIADEINANFPNVGSALECFSNKVAPTTFILHYVPKTDPTNIPDDLRDAMLWECAGRTLEILNKPDRAKNAYMQVERYFSKKYGLQGEER